MKIFSKKICLLGDEKVGKSTLLKFLLEDTTPLSKSNLNVGVKIAQKNIQYKKEECQIVFWDIQGLSHAFHLPLNYLSGSQIGIFIGDVTRKETLLNLHQYKELFLRKNPKAKIFIIFNKIDLLDKNKPSWSEEDDVYYISLKDETGFKKFYKALLQEIFLDL